MLKKYLKRKAVNFVTKHLLKTIQEEDVLRIRGNNDIICKGKRLNREELDALKAEAEFLKKSVALKLILLDLEYLANQTMFAKSMSFDDMQFGKAQLYVIDILKKKINNLAD